MTSQCPQRLSLWDHTKSIGGRGDSWRSDSITPDGKTLSRESEPHGMAVSLGHPGGDHPHPILSTQASGQECIWSYTSFSLNPELGLCEPTAKRVFLSARPSQIALPIRARMLRDKVPVKSKGIYSRSKPNQDSIGTYKGKWIKLVTATFSAKNSVWFFFLHSSYLHFAFFSFFPFFSILPSFLL